MGGTANGVSGLAVLRVARGGEMANLVDIVHPGGDLVEADQNLQLVERVVLMHCCVHHPPQTLRLPASPVL